MNLRWLSTSDRRSLSTASVLCGVLLALALASGCVSPAAIYDSGSCHESPDNKYVIVCDFQVGAVTDPTLVRHEMYVSQEDLETIVGKKLISNSECSMYGGKISGVCVPIERCKSPQYCPNGDTPGGYMNSDYYVQYEHETLMQKYTPSFSWGSKKDNPHWVYEYNRGLRFGMWQKSGTIYIIPKGESVPGPIEQPEEEEDEVITQPEPEPSPESPLAPEPDEPDDGLPPIVEPAPEIADPTLPVTEPEGVFSALINWIVSIINAILSIFQ